MEPSPPPPLRAELVESRRPRPRATGAVLVAALPLLARLAVWWLSRPRPGSGPAWAAPASQVERTEMWVTRRWPGRWKLRVVSTRWMVAPPAPRRGRAAPPWLRLLARSGPRPTGGPPSDLLGLPAPMGADKRVG
ncbi:MAG: hypothetical protein ACYCS9_04305 [Candidatus Dormibacteria bacterium]